MGIIGIAANPASGKDIRRLVSHATVFDNHEKTNIIQRILRTVAAMGPYRVLLMPDRYNFGARLQKLTEQNPEALPEGLFEIQKMPSRETAEDTTEFARRMREQNASALIVLGGDGTCRAAAKEIGHVPLIAVSTGTNNAYPAMCEGTAVGMAAAALAGGYVRAADCAARDKRIEVYLNGRMVDIALVDAAFVRHAYGGTKAVWNPEDIERVVVAACHPANIGFSSLIGCTEQVRQSDGYGATAAVHRGAARKAAFSAGVVREIRVGAVRRLPLDEMWETRPDYSGMLALDGEKEVSFRPGDCVGIAVRRKGPLRVQVHTALEHALANGFYA